MKTILIALLSMTAFSVSAFETKVICSKFAAYSSDIYDLYPKKINELINKAKVDGFTKVLNTTPILTEGFTTGLCVTVTKESI
jgi:hypothetical protein